MQNSFKIIERNFDLVIIGSGGAGIMAALSAKDSGIKNICIISKVIPTNSHTVAAKGGINAPLGNVSKDDWRWHAFDTIKGSDYLADEDVVDILCQNANQAILELEKYGVVFSRNSDGAISQRAYGGQTTDFGQGDLAYRACYSKDKTGQTILHTLYSQALKNDITFFSEFFVFDLLTDSENSCFGCIAIDINNGEVNIFNSKITIIATGGYSQIFKNNTSSLICTGDGTSLAAQSGYPLKDMEFIQFHPTGIFNQGFLISEAARSEGAHLINSKGERFMSKYSPKLMELSSRDIISRAIAYEVANGNGCGASKKSIYLDLRHLTKEVLQEKLPGVVETAKNFAKTDVKNQPLEIYPTAHYTMGGISVNKNCEVTDEFDNANPTLLAVGECACASVHGANRLGCNSLLDLIVFGKIAGKTAHNNIKKINSIKSNLDDIKKSKIINLCKILENKNNSNDIKLDNIKKEIQEISENYFGVFRNQSLLETGISMLKKLEIQIDSYNILNKSLLLNDELIAFLEVKNLFLNTFISISSALERKESRGSHYREDFSKKDDLNFLHHTISVIKNNKIIFYKGKIRRKIENN